MLEPEESTSFFKSVTQQLQTWQKWQG